MAKIAALLGAAACLAGLPAAADEEPGISGTVFLDKNGNGVRDAGKPGFAGVGVILFGHSRDGGPLYLLTRTDAQGRYFFPGNRVGYGSTFTVTTGGAPLAALAPTRYAAARTFYVAANGSDANPGSLKRPFRTIAKAVPTLQGGDVLYIRAGEYREYLSSSAQPLSGGTDWDHPVVVAGMPGETVVIAPPDMEGKDLLVNFQRQSQQYIVLDNLVLDAEDTTAVFQSQPVDGKGSPPCHIRVVNCELKHSRKSAATVAGDDHQFINCRIHNNGHTGKDHGLDIAGGHNLVQGCDIYFNAACGIRLFNGSEAAAAYNVVRGNRVHDNSLTDSEVSRNLTFGIGLHTGVKNLVYDNLIWANSIGVVVSINGCEESIVNNTIYANKYLGIAISPDDETKDNIVRNNIVTGNRDPNILCKSRSTAVDHNLTSGGPLFRNADALDFHILPNSLAVDKGVEISDVRYDFDGTARPQQTGYDQGAYEYSAENFTPTTRLRSAIYLGGRKEGIDIGFASKAK